jgi:hypothetical protein
MDAVNHRISLIIPLAARDYRSTRFRCHSTLNFDLSLQIT